ncbi:double-strand break repair protein MRE11-like, partial [Apium graveolens]
VGECLQERVKERSHSKDPAQFTSSGQSLENIRSTKAAGSAVSFSDDEDSTQLYGTKSATRGRKVASQSFRSSHDAPEISKPARGKGSRGRGRGRGSSNLKQTTLDASMGVRSGRSASVAATASVRSIAAEEENVDSASSDEDVQYNEVDDSPDDDVRGNSRKRPAAPRGRGRGSSSKRGKKTDSVTSSIQRMMMNRDDDDDDDDDHVTKKVPASQTRVTRNYGALRR